MMGVVLQIIIIIKTITFCHQIGVKAQTIRAHSVQHNIKDAINFIDESLCDTKWCTILWMGWMLYNFILF